MNHIITIAALVVIGAAVALGFTAIGAKILTVMAGVAIAACGYFLMYGIVCAFLDNGD